MAPETLLSVLLRPRLLGSEPGLPLGGRGQPGGSEAGAQHRSQDQGADCRSLRIARAAETS